MKRIPLSLVIAVLLIQLSMAQGSQSVADLFTIKCAICHTIGGGKLIGPDLQDVTERRSEDWLIEFIRSSQKMINGGDPDAVAVFEEYNKVLMPDPLISDDEIRSLLSYITKQSAAGGGAAEAYASLLDDVTEEDIASGKSLFDGKKRFKNGGPSCLSCHNDISTYFFSENSYSSKDIRASFATLGEQGVRAILENPPFPVMREALKGHDLEENEVRDLLAYLKSAGTSGDPTPKTSGYFLYGLIGTVIIFFLLAGIWYERKTRSVNHKIYERQIRSIN